MQGKWSYICMYGVMDVESERMTDSSPKMLIAAAVISTHRRIKNCFDLLTLLMIQRGRSRLQQAHQHKRARYMGTREFSKDQHGQPHLPEQHFPSYIRQHNSGCVAKQPTNRSTSGVIHGFGSSTHVLSIVRTTSWRTSYQLVVLSAAVARADPPLTHQPGQQETTRHRQHETLRRHKSTTARYASSTLTSSGCASHSCRASPLTTTGNDAPCNRPRASPVAPAASSASRCPSFTSARTGSAKSSASKVSIACEAWKERSRVDSHVW